MEPKILETQEPTSIVGRFFSFLGFICELFLAAMVVLTTLEVLLRVSTGVSLNISEELCGYLLVGVSFFSFGIATFKGQLLRVDLMIARLSLRMQIMITFVFETVSLLVSVVVFYQVLKMALSTLSRGNVSDTWLQMPLFIPQFAMPLGMAGVIYALIHRLARGVSQLKKSQRHVD